MSLEVSKLPPVRIAPSKPTPSGTLPLSPLDNQFQVLQQFEVIQVFRHGEQPIEAIREALPKALVYYYPVAGRFYRDKEGKFQVECTGDGVWFVEAEAACNLEDFDLHDLEATMVAKEHLLPSAPAGEDEKFQILMMQVTQFKCGGFIVGIKFSHTFFDGIGAAQFTNAVAEIVASGGVAEPTIKPIWARETIFDPRPVMKSEDKPLPDKKPLPEEDKPLPEEDKPLPDTKPLPEDKPLPEEDKPLPDTKPLPEEDKPLPEEDKPKANPLFKLPAYERHVVDISYDNINIIKDDYFKQTGRTCSMFDVITAKVWQSRTRATGLGPDAEIALSFPVDIRRAFMKFFKLEGGYYGNCLFSVQVKKQLKEIASSSLIEVMNVIMDTKEGIPSRLLKWMSGDPNENTTASPFMYESMMLTDCRKLGFEATDYGWGLPIYTVPLNVLPMCVVVGSPPPKKGVRLVTMFLLKEHVEAFQDEFKGLAE